VERVDLRLDEPEQRGGAAGAIEEGEALVEAAREVRRQSGQVEGAGDDAAQRVRPGRSELQRRGQVFVQREERLDRQRARERIAVDLPGRLPQAVGLDRVRAAFVEVGRGARLDGRGRRNQGRERQRERDAAPSPVATIPPA
jgi:hypothetical protein